MLECVGLADIIENGDKDQIEKYLQKTLGKYKGKIENVVFVEERLKMEPLLLIVLMQFQKVWETITYFALMNVTNAMQNLVH